MADNTRANFLEAEQAVLGAILVDSRCLPEVAETLKPDDFGTETNRAIYRAALELYSDGQAVDPVTILDACRRAGNAPPEQYLLQLMEITPTAANVAAYVPIVRENALRRGVLALAEQARAGVAAKEDPGQLLSRLASGLQALEQEGTLNTLLTPLKLADRWAEHRMAVESRDKTMFIPTGFRDVDIILGGLINGGMHVLAARPGMGKTTFALNIAENVAAKVGPVLFVSLEMSDKEIMSKRIAREAGIDSRKVLAESLDYEEQQRHAAALERLAARPLNINYKPVAGIDDIAAMARQIRGLRLIVIDYIGIMQPPPHSEKASRYEQVSNNSQKIKQLARRMNIPILALCQINREVEKRANKRPNMADLRDSGAIEQDADTITFLHRPEYYGDKKQRDPLAPYETECIMEKNRHGATGECTLAFFKKVSKFLTANSSPREGMKKAVEAGKF